MKYFITMGDRIHEVDLVRRLGELLVTVNGEPMDLTYSEADRFGQVTLLHDGRSFGISIEGSDSEVSVTLAGYDYFMQIEDEREYAAHVAERAVSSGGGTIEAVMPGVVVETLVAIGDEVSEGQTLLLIEAMKVFNPITAPRSGTVTKILITNGAPVEFGEPLLILE